MTTQTTDEGKAVAKSPQATLRALLEANKSQIAAALPRHMTPDRMLRIAMTAAQKTPKLLECHPVTFLGAIIQCSQLGLEPNDGTGKAWLIPFNNKKKNRLEVQFIPGYRGLLELVRRTDEISAFDVRIVREKDAFGYSYGTSPKIEHTPAKGEAGAMTHVYAVARFRDGSVQFEVMTKAEVDSIRKRSKSSGDGPWVTDYEEMARKTVTRRISKYLPSSTELAKAAALDERQEVGLPQDLGTIIDVTETETEQAEPGQPITQPQRASEAEKPETPAQDGAAVDAEAGHLVGNVAKGKRAGEFQVLISGKSYAANETLAKAAQRFKESGARVEFDATEGGVLQEIRAAEAA